MKQTILIHGAPEQKEFFDPAQPSPSNAHWFPWLQKVLTERGEFCQALEYPKPYDPSYVEWVEVFEQQTITEETTLIGHSCGGGFLLRYLSEHPLKVHKVCLVAPWLDPKKTFTEDFFDFTLNPDITKLNEVHLFVSADDEESVLASVEIILQAVPGIVVHHYTNKEHFTGSEFSELLAVL